MESKKYAKNKLKKKIVQTAAQNITNLTTQTTRVEIFVSQWACPIWAVSDMRGSNRRGETQETNNMF